VKVLVLVLLVLGRTGTSLAIDQPPATAAPQRAWLLSHLTTDMRGVGSFTSDDIAQAQRLINSLRDDQVSLLARFYYLTRAKTEQDAQLYAVQQTDTAETLAQEKAQVADLLAQLQSQIEQTYSELATINPGCETLCQVTYASVPGWCASNQCAIPEAYYHNGCYVGPVYSASYCNAYAVRVYNAFYNRGGRYNFWNSRTFVHNHFMRAGHAMGTNRVATPVVRHDPPKLHTPAVVAKNHAGAPAVNHAKHARPANHSKPQAVAHTHVHAAPRPRPQRVAHTARPQHVAQAHLASAHGRRR
jgi:hypothetical protein